MLRKDLPAMLAGLVASALVATSGPAAQAQEAKAPAFTGQKYVKDAKISLDEARSIALKTYAGEIVSQGTLTDVLADPKVRAAYYEHSAEEIHQ